MVWQPMMWAGVLAGAYVRMEGPDAYIDYRVLVLRLAILFVCMGAAFALDDATEDTLSYVPAPLLLRRLLRVLLLLPLAAATWFLLVETAGEVTRRDGGPLPVGDLTVEAGAMLAVTLVAASIGSRVTSDRLGGIVAAPILLALAVGAIALPGDYKLIVTPADPRWADVHETWRWILVAAVAAFIWLNRSQNSYRTMARLRALRPASRPT